MAKAKRAVKAADEEEPSKEEPKAAARDRRRTTTTAKRARKEKAPAKAAPARKEKRAVAAALEQVSLYSVGGDITGTVQLPRVFHTPLRTDLIRRAVTAARANRRQPYGPSPTAGIRHSVRWSGKGHGVSRVPRIRGTMIGAQAPGTVGGRRAHPPRPRTIWAKKINDQERRYARFAAVAATRDPVLVASRGHRFRENLTLPIVVEDDIESLEKTSDGIEALRALGVFADVERSGNGTAIRAGRGKMRGRRYRTPKSLLLVFRDAPKGRRVFGNLPGVDVAEPRNLNAELLAPGGDPGRLAVFSRGAIEDLRGWT